ncbi:tyrosine-type recombinase/integrase [Chroococcus sp. FPU101]|uniref:tyrosine-type recombinase/integrase n=1 Tax=Chroococcus sp. FPU101 TaxID=1974212 RepID=UPI001A8E7401|nr:tyrosine-type recombinase/integrase [Chroococcus sp. FPU101]GFE71665.1 integrase family protein [Chroococcus sp. FPU101]
MLPKLEHSLPENLKLTEPIPLTLHPAGVYLSLLSEGSRRTIRYSLSAIASILTNSECDALTLDWSKLRYHHTAAIRVALLEKFAPVTANKMLSALRRVLREAYRLGLMQAEDYQKAVDFPNIKAEPEPRGRSLAGEEISALLATCSSDSPLDVRDAAIIAMLRGTGIRRSELVKLELKDFKALLGELEVRKSKRGKSRKVYLPIEAIPFVEKWLSVRGHEPGALFCRIHKGGHLHLSQMHPDAIWRIVQKRAAMAGLEFFSPHDFRRTFCSDLLDAGVDIVTVQKLAGHASVVTTAKYDRRGEETKRKAVQCLSMWNDD